MPEVPLKGHGKICFPKTRRIPYPIWEEYCQQLIYNENRHKLLDRPKMMDKLFAHDDIPIIAEIIDEIEEGIYDVTEGDYIAA